MRVGEIADDEIGIFVAFHFFEAAFGQFAGDGFMDVVANFVGIQLEHDEVFDAADVGESLVFGEIEIGIEVDVFFRGGWRGEEDREEAEEESGDWFGEDGGGGVHLEAPFVLDKRVGLYGTERWLGIGRSDEGGEPKHESQRYTGFEIVLPGFGFVCFLWLVIVLGLRRWRCFI